VNRAAARIHFFSSLERSHASAVHDLHADGGARASKTIFVAFALSSNVRFGRLRCGRRNAVAA